MSRAGDLLREETKRRASSTWMGKLSKIGAWFQAAEWLDEQMGPQDPTEWPDLVTLANALRYDYTEGRGHGKQPEWDEVSQQIRDIWLKRAKQVDDYIRREANEAT